MQMSGEIRRWHKITLDFEGPTVQESASTFRDYRLDVTFGPAGAWRSGGPSRDNGKGIIGAVDAPAS